jgi:putative transposase
VVDTLGMIWAVSVHAGSLQDRDGAKAVLAQMIIAKLCGLLPRLKLIWADGGYAGQLIGWLWAASGGGWVLEIVKRSDDVKGFAVLPKRWIVERTFAWLGRYRRLSKDYETLTKNSETMIQLAMINLMVHRLKPE